MKFIIPPLIGAIIGYITNWLAIKMLFKPYNEKRILGVKVPFTPGVIPKERKRIATNIGTAVGNHLLTDTVIKEKLTNEETKKIIANRVLTELDIDKLSIEQVLQFIYGDDYSTQIEKIEEWLAEKIHQEINKDYNITLINTSLKKYVKETFYNTPIEEMLSDEQTQIINQIIIDKMPSIIKTIKELKYDIDFEAKLKEGINSFIQQKLGSLGAMFVSADTIYAGIIEKIEEELDKEDTRKWIGEIIQDKIEEIIAKKPNEIVEEEVLDQIIGSVLDNAIPNIVESFTVEKIHQGIHVFVLQLIKTEIIISWEIKERIISIVMEKWDSIIEANIDDMIKQLNIPKMIESEMNKMEIVEIENILLLIVKKELRAITWFGALLGFVMGLILIIS